MRISDFIEQTSDFRVYTSDLRGQTVPILGCNHPISVNKTPDVRLTCSFSVSGWPAPSQFHVDLQPPCFRWPTCWGCSGYPRSLRHQPLRHKKFTVKNISESWRDKILDPYTVMYFPQLTWTLCRHCQTSRATSSSPELSRQTHFRSEFFNSALPCSLENAYFCLKKRSTR